MSEQEETILLNHLAEGCTANEIAALMNTSTRTINFRLQVLYAKYRIPPGKHRGIKLLRETGYINIF